MQEKMTDHSIFPGGNPFRVPEGYFETLEDRVEVRINESERKISGGQKLITLMKPVLGLAASFALAFLLIYYPISKILPWYTARHTEKKIRELRLEEQLLNDYRSLDENTFYLALPSREDPKVPESEELFSFLTAELDDYEVYSEIIN